jgi:hypothetical protein
MRNKSVPNHFIQQQMSSRRHKQSNQGHQAKEGGP